jgi:hypothetical protein
MGMAIQQGPPRPLQGQGVQQGQGQGGQQLQANQGQPRSAYGNHNQGNHHHQPQRQTFRQQQINQQGKSAAPPAVMPSARSVATNNPPPALAAASVQAAIQAQIPEQVLDPRYSKIVCYNCGDPWNFVGNCVHPKLCFISNLAGHPVYSCPERSTDHPVADYFGSANSGLGFYHIDVPDDSETQWLSFRNCGVVVVKKGETSLSNLE